MYNAHMGAYNVMRDLQCVHDVIRVISMQYNGVHVRSQVYMMYMIAMNSILVDGALSLTSSLMIKMKTIQQNIMLSTCTICEYPWSV